MTGEEEVDERFINDENVGSFSNKQNDIRSVIIHEYIAEYSVNKN